MPYSLKQAATATGKSKPTILRAIQTGKISAEKDEQGEWQIEPAELHRVYQPVPERNGSDEPECNDTQQADSPIEAALLRAEVQQMRERFASIDIDRERERHEASETIADLRRRLDQSETSRLRLASSHGPRAVERMPDQSDRGTRARSAPGRPVRR